MIFALLFVLFLSSCQLGAETFVFSESYRTFKSSDTYHTTTVWGQTDFNKRVGGFVWGQVGKTYQQTYGGFFVRATSWLQAGIATGQEQGRGKRLGSFGFATKGRYHVFAIYEDFGKTGYWYYTQTDIRVSKKWSVGTHHQAFLGHGPRVEYRLPPIARWIPSVRFATVWDGKRSAPNIYIGLRFTYFKGD